ncbi:MAG: PAS domain S-box protein [Solirubrobacteraceae bacterium]
MFRQLFDGAPDAIVGINGSGEIVLVNAQTEQLFKYRREDLIGQPVETLVPERLREDHAAHRGGYFAHPRPMGARLDLYGRRSDRGEFPVQVSHYGGASPPAADEIGFAGLGGVAGCG